MIFAALELLLRSGLLLLIVWSAAALVGRSGGSAAMRHLVWLCGLGGVLLLPLVGALAPSLALPVPPELSRPQLLSASAPGLAPSPALSGIEVGGEAGLATALPLDPLWTLYLAVALALAGRLALGRIVLARLWRRAAPCDSAWRHLLAELRLSLAIRRPVALRLARSSAMPMTWGSLRPRILLPAEAAFWSEERRRLVLLHELAHVARGDSLSRLTASAACALYWFQPAIWLAARRMRLEQEHACDDLVIARGAPANHYARELLDIAIAFRPPALAGAASIGMAGRSELERRLAAILARRPRRRPNARFAASCAACALLTTALLASVKPVAAVGEDPGLAALRAEEALVQEASGPEGPVRPRKVSESPPARTRGPARSTASAESGPLPDLVDPEPAASVSYEQMAERHRRDLADYNAQLVDYNRRLVAYSRQHNRDLTAYNQRLRALQGNLANAGNSGNSGHSGNSGNFGNPGRPARPGAPAIPPTPPTPPTAPVMPTPPTPPTMPTPLRALPSAQSP